MAHNIYDLARMLEHADSDYLKWGNPTDGATFDERFKAPTSFRETFVPDISQLGFEGEGGSIRGGAAGGGRIEYVSPSLNAHLSGGGYYTKHDGKRGALTALGVSKPVGKDWNIGVEYTNQPRRDAEEPPLFPGASPRERGVERAMEEYLPSSPSRRIMLQFRKSF